MVVRLPHDRLDTLVLVAGCEEKGVAVRANTLVLGERRLESVRAGRLGALADEACLFRLEALRALRDSLVHLAVERFGAGNLLDLAVVHR